MKKIFTAIFLILVSDFSSASEMTKGRETEQDVSEEKIIDETEIMNIKKGILHELTQKRLDCGYNGQGYDRSRKSIISEILKNEDAKIVIITKSNQIVINVRLDNSQTQSVLNFSTNNDFDQIKDIHYHSYEIADGQKRNKGNLRNPIIVTTKVATLKESSFCKLTSREYTK
jgi:predicted transcriptional regulator